MILETDGLSKFYGDVVALNDIDLDIPQGLTGLLGPNGAGKTTLLHLMTGQLEPSQGRLRVLGEDPWRNDALRQRVGFVPETLSLWDHMDGTGHVELTAKLSSTSTSRVDEVLQIVGLAEDANRNVSGYSRGMRQRLKLAMALVHEPELLILDEPFAGLDPVGRREMMNLLHRLGEAGKSVLFSSHVLHEVQTLTRNIVVLVGGHVVAVGDVHKIRELMDQHPHQVRVTVDRPRQLARDLVTHEDVVQIQVDDEHREVEAKTNQPSHFYDRLQRILLDDDYQVDKLTSPDDNLQAVFEYLTREDTA